MITLRGSHPEQMLKFSHPEFLMEIYHPRLEMKMSEYNPLPSEQNNMSKYRYLCTSDGLIAGHFSKDFSFWSRDVNDDISLLIYEFDMAVRQ